MVIIPAFKEAFAADGAQGGLIQVVASNKYWPGAVANIEGVGMPGLKVIILSATDATHIQVKLHPDEGVSSDGRTTKMVSGTQPADLTGYTTVKVSTINVPQQTVYDVPMGGVIPRLPNFWT
jgi:hypothetical protein